MFRNNDDLIIIITFIIVIRTISIGLPADRITAAVNETNVTLEIVREPDEWTTLTTNYGSRTFSVRFRVGEEYETTRPDGRTVRGRATRGENRSFTIVENDGTREVTYLRQFGEGTLTQVY